MGSFAYTCGISGLPIEAGDRVKFFLVSSGPWPDEIKCHMHDDWFPRTFPLTGKYDDYGGVEEIEEKDNALQALWLRGFQVDLVERGWGANSFHDPSCLKTWSFSEMLGALHENRIKVLKDAQYPPFPALVPSNIPLPEPPVGVPTLQRINTFLKENGYRLHGKTGAGQAFMVDDDEGQGRIRVRCHVWEHNEAHLQALQEKLKPFYATMITRGTGSYADKAELLVRPLPSVDKYNFNKRDLNKALSVRQCMVREDVWNALLAIKCKPDMFAWGAKVHKVEVSAEEMIKGARAFWDSATDVPVDLAPGTPDAELTVEQLKIRARSAIARMRLDLGIEDRSGHPLASFFTRSAVPSVMGLSEHFRMMIEMFLEGKTTQAEVAAFLKTAGEMMFVGYVLANTRYTWRPSYCTGPQFGAWGDHNKVLGVFKKIALREHKQYLKDMK